MLTVIEVFLNYIVCQDKENQTYIDTEGLAILFEEGDKIDTSEYNFSSVYRNGEVIGGITNLFTRKFVR